MGQKNNGNQKYLLITLIVLCSTLLMLNMLNQPSTPLIQEDMTPDDSFLPLADYNWLVPRGYCIAELIPFR